MREWLHNVDVEDMFDCMDVDYEHRGGELRIPCPFHDGMHNTLSINPESTVFFCHKCKERGVASDLVARLLGISMLEATRMLKERYQPGFINPDARDTVAEIRKILERKVASEPEQPILDESELGRFAVNWPEAWMAWRTPGWESFHACDYLFERGFEPEWLEDWEFGWDARSERITFAVRDVRGHLIGFKGRVVDDRQPKYLVVGDKPGKGHHYGWPTYYVSRVVFGANRIKPDTKTLVICEGEWNAIAVRQKLDMPAVAINGSNFSETQARIIRDLAERVIIFLDSDKAGQMATWGWTNDRGEYHPGVVDQLRPFISVRVVPDHEGDPMDLVSEVLTNLIDEAKPWTLASIA